MFRLKSTVLCLVAVIFASPLYAGDPVEGVMKGCSAEIGNYCSQVTLGEGRLMACFYAHEDKLSVNCLHALYDAAAALDAAIDAMVYIATECEADIDEFCGQTVPGEGRILNCLSSSRDSLSESCSAALQDAEE